MAVNKAEIVAYLRGVEGELDATWEGDAGNADVFFCSGVNVDEDTHEITGFRMMEQGDGPQCSAGYGEFRVEVLGVSFTHDGDEDCWEDHEWECGGDLEDGELPGDGEDVDAALQAALDEKVRCVLPDAEDRCSERLSDDALEEALSDEDYDLFFVDADTKDPRTVYVLDSCEIEEDELDAFKEGKREVTLSCAVRILQKGGYDVELE